MKIFDFIKLWESETCDQTCVDRGCVGCDRTAFEIKLYHFRGMWKWSSCFYFASFLAECINLLSKKPPPLPVSSTHVEVSPKNFLTFSFNPFVTLVQNFKAITAAIPKLLNLKQDHPSRNWFFCSYPYKIEQPFFLTSLKL